jgi:ParB family transcriptional regulator, chromosome partitioning protein
MTSGAKGGEKRRALGRGLESLLPRAAAAPASAAAAAEPEPPAASTGTPLEIDVEQIERNPFQTRVHFDPKLLEELGASISANGVIQPVVVRPLGEGRYQLISGERRWLASKLVGKNTVPAVVREVGDSQALEITIVENLQRADLNPLEQARGFERLGREFGMTQEQVAQRTGKDRASVANYLRLLRLPAEVQAMVERGDLTMGHAKALLALDDRETLVATAKRVVEGALSVRGTEKLVQGLLLAGLEGGKREEKPKPYEDPNVREARELLQRALGLKVTIEDKKGRGRLTIEYGSVEDFDELMVRLMPGER